MHLPIIFSRATSIFREKSTKSELRFAVLAIAIGNVTSRKNLKWVLTYQGSELSGSVVF
ncbi:hypothetical protein [Nostoc sp. NMS4]|uniref:hypothetical protein n=1 Tax=Nostoc sp. NMS4 TaxID=2815390 RepID=UPI0025E014E8|nr:hypothetical protein [Nostoc sp. NMS4]MBN3925157.1 hypothetical protein [Nostoc sp. NMS4]